MQALVSVIIPVYNAGEFLEETIESVIGQTYQNVEIILVNNCSTEEDTIALLKRLSNKHKVVDSEIKGLAQARNDGIAAASGEFILPLDADDLLKPDFIERCIALFQEKPELSLVRTHIELFGKKKGTIDASIENASPRRDRVQVIQIIPQCRQHHKQAVYFRVIV